MTDQRPDIDIEAERTAFIIARKGVHYCDCMLEGWLARARLAAEREREMQHTIDEYTKRIEELETLLKRAHHPTCSMNCPSHVEISEGYGHCELCRKITAALAKREERA